MVKTKFDFVYFLNIAKAEKLEDIYVQPLILIATLSFIVSLTITMALKTNWF